jgi:hypothetical protein
MPSVIYAYCRKQPFALSVIMLNVVAPVLNLTLAFSVCIIRYLSFLALAIDLLIYLRQLQLVRRFKLTCFACFYII